MRPRDELFCRACEVGQQEATRMALRLVKCFPGDDEADCGPGAAWLKDRTNPGLAAADLAEALQAEARRRRAESVIGPPRRKPGQKITLADRRRAANAQAILSAGAAADPLAVLELLQAADQVTAAEVAVAGAAALLDSLCHASGTELASQIGRTPRRGQQIRAQQRAALEAGQQDLFAEAEL